MKFITICLLICVATTSAKADPFAPILKLAQDNAKPAVLLEISDQASTKLLESRIGGLPAWPKGQDAPKTSEDFATLFLAQLNLEDLNPPEPFPQIGLLQFFITADDLYGAEFDDYTKGSFKVVYHENLSDLELKDIYADTKLELYVHPFQYENWQREGRLILAEGHKDLPLSGSDYRIEEQLETIGEEYWENEHYQAFFDKMWEPFSPLHAIIGGNPDFVQQDPRFYNKELREFDYTLLNILSGYESIMWGDLGTGTFLITKEDLEKRNFDRILYNYDSH